jgi:cation:H+ antiporter
MIGVSGLAWVCASDGRVGVGDGLILLGVVTGYTVWLLRASAADPPDPVAPPETVAAHHGAIGSIGMALAGLGLLLLGARWLVDAAVAIAAALGVSDALIGLTLVAAGTSLPEVAASIVAALRGHRDMAVGNVLGSNILNLTVILGITSVSAGGLHVAGGILGFDLVVMLAVAVACLPILGTGHTISRWEGGLVLAYYAAYITYLVLDVNGDERLSQFTDAMTLFALPLTAVTLAVLAARVLVSPSKPRRDLV